MKSKNMADVLFDTVVEFGYVLLFIIAVVSIATMLLIIGKVIFGTPVISILFMLLVLVLVLLFIKNLLF